MPSWPGTLPSAPLVDGYRESIPETAIRTTMEQGPAKLRRRTTAQARTLGLEYIMSAEQVTALETFFISTLSGGVLSFTFTHPRTGNSVSCRFKKPPQYTAHNGLFYHVAIELEVLP